MSIAINHAPQLRSGLDLVFSSVHVVDSNEIICPWGKSLRVALWNIILLQMSLFSQRTHLGRKSAKGLPSVLVMRTLYLIINLGSHRSSGV